MLTIQNIDRIKGMLTANLWNVTAIVVDTKCYTFYMEYTMTVYNPMTFTPNTRVQQKTLELERELDSIGLGYKLKRADSRTFHYVHKSDLKDVYGLLNIMGCLL